MIIMGESVVCAGTGREKNRFGMVRNTLVHVSDMVKSLVELLELCVVLPANSLANIYGPSHILAAVFGRERP